MEQTLVQEQLWNSKEIIGAVLATGLISAVAREIIDSWKSRRRSKREASYIAIRSAVALEAFAQACASLADEMTASYKTYGQVGPIKLPELPKYPPDADWRLLSINDSDQLLSFLNDIQIAQSHADHARDFENNDWHLHTVAGEFGQKAWETAKYLRKRYRLPAQGGLAPIFARVRAT